MCLSSSRAQRTAQTADSYFILALRLLLIFLAVGSGRVRVLYVVWQQRRGGAKNGGGSFFFSSSAEAEERTSQLHSRLRIASSRDGSLTAVSESVSQSLSRIASGECSSTAAAQLKLVENCWCERADESVRRVNSRSSQRHSPIENSADKGQE